LDQQNLEVGFLGCRVMLIDLSIRDIVLIDSVNMELAEGLCALTGETGAGKSILLDALGLALGERAESRLVRQGAAKAVVTAQFEVSSNAEVGRLLDEHDIDCNGELVLRRVLSVDGRSRAYINDQAVSIGLLRRLGERLVEVHGQHEGHGLLRVSTHRRVLDEYGGLTDVAGSCSEAYRRLRERISALEQAQERFAAAVEEEDYLRHVCAELETLSPQPGEEEKLAQRRALLRDGEQIAEVLKDASAEMAGADGVNDTLRRAQVKLERIAEKTLGRLDPVLTSLSNAAGELGEGIAQLEELMRDVVPDPARLEEVEDRWFALRDAARKHRVGVDELPGVLQRLAEKLASIEGGEAEIEELEAAVEKAQAAYRKKAMDLSDRRRAAARAFDNAVSSELPPLALEKAIFRTDVNTLDEADWGPDGMDRVRFQIATNPGQEPDELSRVASGGELSRIMLALKVVLAGTRDVDCMIFDEVDQGIGGAVADKVGERLARLSHDHQILVVTHSPQVAARADHHWRIQKAAAAGESRADVAVLDGDERREEIARMLAGAKITHEARAAADSLITAGRA
jgi:DNA repair protein RecN (Recombination protein N)